MTARADTSLSPNSGHIPVLLDEVLTALDASDGDIVVDGTFGAGGYSRAILDCADITLYGIDRDPAAIERAKAFKEFYGDRFSILEGCFGDMKSLLASAGVTHVDAIVLDIGVSSFQIDQAERGFSFQGDGPLDMRMSLKGETAADVVNNYGEEEIANIIYEFGEERKSRWIANAIVKARVETPFTKTSELASVVAKAIGFKRKKNGKSIHPATKTFQALRIHVNDELGELKRALKTSASLLKPGGRLVVVSFHSLEDRIVKNFMIEQSGLKSSGSRHLPQSMTAGPAPTFELKRKGAVKPSEDEISRNPRARSSRLRVAVRTEAAELGSDL